jgi:hypothetical protein
MKIQPVKISVTDEKDAVNMQVTASDVWGENGSYEAIATLTDEDGNIVAQPKVLMSGKDYQDWDGNNRSVLELILNTYPFIKIA